MSAQSEMRIDADKRENVTLPALKVRGRLWINVQTEGGAADGIDGRDFK